MVAFSCRLCITLSSLALSRLRASSGMSAALLWSSRPCTTLPVPLPALCLIPHCRPGMPIVPECALAKHTGRSLHSLLDGYAIRYAGWQCASCEAMISSPARNNSVCCSASSVIAFLSPQIISLLIL